MSFKPLISDDCCLLINIDLNSQRIYHLLERRFKSNSTTTSFDFKLFPPEQPSNNAKVSRSLLRCQPKITSTYDYEENISSDSSTSEEEDNDEVSSVNDDDYLDKLAEWEPDNFQPVVDTDDDDDEEENIIQSVSTENNDENNQMDHSSGKHSIVHQLKLIIYIQLKILLQLQSKIFLLHLSIDLLKLNQ
jgi:hypothetical protein